jgi:N utilization substance protein A
MSELLFGNMEILQVADAVAREQQVPKEVIIKALEEAIRVAARRKYGQEHSVRVEIDRKSGEINLCREMLVVKSIEDEIPEEIAEEHKSINRIELEDAQVKNPDAEVGDILAEPLPPLDIARLAAQPAKQVIINELGKAKRQKLFEEYKGRIGEILYCKVEKMERGSAIVRIGSHEAMIHRSNLLPNDRLRHEDSVRALLVNVDPERRNSMLELSRTHNNFIAQLFAQEVPEVYDKIIEIKAVARDPGFRAKVAVYSSDPSIDAVGSCVGIRGSRVQAVISELKGEKIDIINWSSDKGKLIIGALAPAEVSRVVIDEDKERLEVIVPDDQLSIAIGREGQNVKLAAELVGWEVDVRSETKDSEQRTSEFNAITHKFMEGLDLDEILAQLLASEGFNSVQSLAESTPEELAAIEGLDEEIAAELIKRAVEYSETHNDAAAEASDIAAIDLDEKVLSLVDKEIAEQLYHAGIKNITDLADLSNDEFKEQLPHLPFNDEEIGNLIMKARDMAYFAQEEENKK